ncbi:MAG: 50S ribosomal protein L25 [Bacillota bacterium]|nr:50S ribosomal protein L25 [Bacillota bacterium]
MTEVALSAERRTERGKEAAARLRGRGMIPAVVYGVGRENVNVALNAREVERLLASGRASGLIHLHLDEGEKKLKPTPVLIKEVQRDPVRGSVRHLDLYAVAMDHAVTTHVPIVVHGEEKRRNLGGIVQHVLHSLEISALPADIPEHVEADVSRLPVGHALQVKDLALPKGVKAVTPPEDVVVTIVAPTREKIEEAAPEAEEGAEPEVVAKAKAEEEQKGKEEK